MTSKRLFVNLAIVVLAVAADQAVKALVVANLPVGGGVALLPFLALYHARNTGIAFSLMDGLGPLGLALIAAAVLAVVLVLWAKTPANRPLTHVGLAIIVGGAIGNLIDRLALGYVVDYVYFHTPVWSFAIFNLADAFITVGAGLLLLDEFVMTPRRQAKASRDLSARARN